MLNFMAVLAMKPKNAVESPRDIVQDLLVPELKAIKTELESQRRETNLQFENVRNELASCALNSRQPRKPCGPIRKLFAPSCAFVTSARRRPFKQSLTSWAP